MCSKSCNMLWKFTTPMSVDEPYTAAVLTFPEKKVLM